MSGSGAGVPGAPAGGMTAEQLTALDPARTVVPPETDLSRAARGGAAQAGAAPAGAGEDSSYLDVSFLNSLM